MGGVVKDMKDGFASQAFGKKLLRILGALLVLALLWAYDYFVEEGSFDGSQAGRSSLTTSSKVVEPTEKRLRRPPIPNDFIHGVGTVYRLLPDDREGIPHQKFLIRTSDGDSLMVVHNIKLAPRIDDICVGDSVEYCGEFVDNDKGGLVHWTHHDPDGDRLGGWLIHGGRIYK